MISVPVKLPAKNPYNGEPFVIVALLIDPDENLINLKYTMKAVVVSGTGELSVALMTNLRVEMGAYMDVSPTV